MKEQDIAENKSKLIENLKRAIDIEHTTSFCLGYIASLIKNGRVRAKFYTFAESAKTNKEFLIERLNNAGVSNFVLENECRFCKLKPESFSLMGALNLGLEVTDASIKFYHDLLDLSYRLEDKRLFKKPIKEKIQQRNFLKKEKRFSHNDKAESDFITSYCIPEVISKLWNK